MKPATPAAVKKAQEIFHKNRDFIDYLAMRWGDEKEYEDLADYQKAIQEKLTAPARVISMTKRPFGFRFIVDDSPTSSLFLIQVKESRGRVTHSLSQVA